MPPWIVYGLFAQSAHFAAFALRFLKFTRLKDGVSRRVYFLDFIVLDVSALRYIIFMWSNPSKTMKRVRFIKREAFAKNYRQISS